ncbi:MAG: WG repeat-containing protein [Faecousia sp.]
MKSLKKILPVVLVVLLSLAWYSFFSGTVDKASTHNDWLRKAEESMEARLYEQAIECYKESLKYDASEEVYLLIKQAYGILYEEEHTAFFRSQYIQDMASAALAYPENEIFWLTQVELYQEENNINQAFYTLKDAINRGVKSEKIQALYKQLLYSVKMDYKQYTDFKTALNGYIAVSDGGSWFVTNDEGEPVTSNYRFVGLINDDGKGIYVNSIDTRLLDRMEVTRARFAIEVEEAGYYNERVDLVPVKMDGVWRYMNTGGAFLPGEFETAGSFYGEQAAAKTTNGWVTINTAGTQVKLNFEDVKLDLYGCHIQNGILLAKQGGKYHLYDLELKQIGDFSADDVDICVDATGIAFQQNGKWGFVNTEGVIVVPPQYTQAKSFANGYAAVCNEQGLWGFINDKFELVIDYAFLDAHYFTQAETCLVSEKEGYMQFMKFVF